MEKFSKSWNPEPKKGIRQRIREAFDKDPIRYKLMIANYKIKAIITRLEASIARLRERDAELFERVVEALQQGDKYRAAVYANEVAEIRKAIKQMMIVKLALEKLSLRLETVMMMGDTVTALAPIVGVVHEIKNYVKGVMPMISLELADLEETLNSVAVEAGEFTSIASVSPAASIEAKKILREAAVIAEQRLREQFPEIPSASSIEEGQEAQV